MVRFHAPDFVGLNSRLIVELNASQHLQRADYDEQRTKFLEGQDFRVLHFWNGAVSSQGRPSLKRSFGRSCIPTGVSSATPSPALPLRGREV